MENVNNFNTIKQFAQIDGLFVGALWVVSFVALLANFSYPAFGIVFFLAMAATPFLVIKRGKRCRQMAFNDTMSFGYACIYSFLTLMFASLIFAIVQFFYFQFLDNGYFIGQYVEAFKISKKELLAIYGISEKDFKSMINTLTSLRPIDLVMEFLWLNMLVSSLLSLFLSLFIKKNTTYQQQ